MKSLGCEPTILFIHIFKAGGSAIFQLLRHYAKLHKLPFLDYTTWVRKQRRLKTGGGELKLTDEEQEYLRQFHIIAGHMWYGKHEYFDSCTYITMLREPMAAAVSAILFDNRDYSEQHARSVSKAVLEVQHFLKNRPERYRCDMINRLVGYRGFEAIDQRLAIAKKNMKTIHVVGILESIQDTLYLVNDHLSRCSFEQLCHIYEECGRNAIPYGFTSQEVVDSLPVNYLTELREYVKYEQELYTFAKILHNQQKCHIRGILSC